jgi:ferritin-like metal-binding protein YciE
VRTFAEILGGTEQANLLEATLEEEKHADTVFTQISDTANTRAEKTGKAA